MQQSNYTGTEFIGGFFALAGGLWLAGALLVGALVIMGQDRVDQVEAASNLTPVATENLTQ